MSYSFFSDEAPTVRIEGGNIRIAFKISGLDDFSTVTVQEGTLTPHAAMAVAKALMQAATTVVEPQCEVIEFTARK